MTIEKIARLGIKREHNVTYFVKEGDVWSTPRRMRGGPPPTLDLVAKVGIEMDFTRYVYFVDGDGDIARMERVAPAPRKRAKQTKAKTKKATKKKATKKKATKKPAKKKAPPRRAALDAEATSRRL